ncbi:MAG: Fic family protein [Deltaproteobacteria bacterium]|nr:Fic family protein [Deltaproteobacteria bacterium]
MLTYFWQTDQWPNYYWRETEIFGPLTELRKIQGHLLGRTADLGKAEETELMAQFLEEDAVQTSAIEGENLNRDSIRSSIALRLGLPAAVPAAFDPIADGLAEVLLDASQNYDLPLDENRLFAWHSALFPEGVSDLPKVPSGTWRTLPRQIVSGPIGRQQVHFDAPPPERVPSEMKLFFSWWEDSLKQSDGLIRAGLAHLYFVTIHPFSDGNGRLARALTDLALAQDEKTGLRLCSLSAQIMKERKEYCRALELVQWTGGDCTDWLLWFFSCLKNAITGAEKKLDILFLKSRFWRTYGQIQFSQRQRKILTRLADAGPQGFEGGLTTKKFAGMAKVSRATAYREIADLLEKGVLIPRPGGGRKAAYEINWKDLQQRRSEFSQAAGQN